MPRGLTNNNPGNLRKNETDKWQGLAELQTDPQFFQFQTAVWGIRAMARTLIAYQDKHGCHTVNDFINRWAPEVDHNDTQAYANHVAAVMGVDPGGNVIDVHQWAVLSPMIKAMILHENGVQPYPDAVIDQALAMAGAPHIERSLVTSGTITAGTAVTAGGAITTGTALVSQLAPAAYGVRPLLDLIHDYGPLLAVIGGITLVGLGGYLVYKKWDAHRRLVG